MKPIRKIKTTYYTKQILLYLLAAGLLTLAGGGPSLGMMLAQHIFGAKKKIQKKKCANLFYYLKRHGFIEWHHEGHDVVMALTQEGRRRAGKYQIDELTLETPKKWDGKWRIVMFDIPNPSTFVRNIFRRKLKEFGFYPLQKSVWVYPFECREEISFLRDFLGATSRQICVIEAASIENDRFLREAFALVRE